MAGSSILRTVLGDVSADQLGPTLIHEHLISCLYCYWEPDASKEISGLPISMRSLASVRQMPFAVRENLVLGNVDRAVEELRDLRDVGGRTVVEVTSCGIGRDPVALRLISERSGVHIIAGCGYYIQPSHPRSFGSRSVEDVTEELVADLTEGIDGTGIRAGVIGELGVATSPPHPAEVLMLRAAAAAQQMVGAAIVVHPAPGVESAFEIVRILSDAGALMEKVVVSHLDERFRGDVDAFCRLGSNGCVLGLDTFGRDIYWRARGRQHPSDADRIVILKRLIDAGLGEQIAIAQDICLQHELRAFGGHGYGHILRNIFPRAAAIGLDEELMTKLVVDTPARILAIESREDSLGQASRGTV